MNALDAAGAAGADDVPYALVVLAPQDGVGIAVADLAPGEHRTSAGGSVVLLEPVALGHKVALADLPADTAVVRAGMPIGVTTRPVPAGAWVHTHNLRSDYLPTYDHRGGER